MFGISALGTPCGRMELSTPVELDLDHPPSTPHAEPLIMATPTPNIKVSLDDRIDALDRNAVEASPAKQVFKTVSVILALIRVSRLFLRPSVNLQ